MEWLKHHLILFCLFFNNRANWEAEDCFVWLCAAGWWPSQDQLVFRLISKPGALYCPCDLLLLAHLHWSLLLSKPLHKNQFTSPDSIYSSCFLYAPGYWGKKMLVLIEFSISYSRFHLSYYFPKNENTTFILKFLGLG